jgi:hypothetical protein
MEVAASLLRRSEKRLRYGPGSPSRGSQVCSEAPLHDLLECGEVFHGDRTVRIVGGSGLRSAPRSANAASCTHIRLRAPLFKVKDTL